MLNVACEKETKRKGNVDPGAPPAWKVNDGVPLDCYFNPVSYLIATKWLSQAKRIERSRFVDKCLKLAERYPPFAQVTALLFFRDALVGKEQSASL